MQQHELTDDLRQELAVTLQQEMLFAGIRQNELRLILTSAKIFEYQDREYLYEEGAIAEECFIVLSGSVSVIVKHHRTGGHIEALHLRTPRIIGATELLLNIPRSSAIQIRDKALVLQLGKKSFHKLLQGVPIFTYRLSHLLADQLTQQEKITALPRLKPKILEQLQAEILSILPIHLLQEHLMIPLAVEGNILRIAFVSEPNKQVIEEIRSMLPGIRLYLYGIGIKNFRALLKHHNLVASSDEDIASSGELTDLVHNPPSPKTGHLQEPDHTAPSVHVTSHPTNLQGQPSTLQMPPELMQVILDQGKALHLMQNQLHQSLKMQAQQYHTYQAQAQGGFPAVQVQSGFPAAQSALSIQQDINSPSADMKSASIYSDPSVISSKRSRLSSEQKRQRLADLLPMLQEMARQGASDLHLSAKQTIRWRIDGDLYEVPGSKVLGEEEVFELLGAMMEERHLLEFERREQADFSYSVDGLARYRVNIYRESNGISAVLRQIPLHVPSVKELRLPLAVSAMTEFRQGLVLVTGPTGSGKSTTLASLIKQINEWNPKHIITLEDPIEFIHPSQKALINQREIGLHAQDFSTALRASLREDPDIVMVGELRDLETMALAIETGLTGHLVFGTLHTNNVVTTIDRIIDMFPSEQHNKVRGSLSEVLKGVVCQVLCKRAGGGRVAAFEVMTINSAVANMIRQAKTYQIPTAMSGKENLLLNAHLEELIRKKNITEQEAMLHTLDKTDMRMRIEQQSADPANRIPIQTTSARKPQ